MLIADEGRRNGVLLEEIQKQLDIAAEGRQALSEKLDRTEHELKGDFALLDQRVMQLDGKVTKLDDKVTKLNKKVDATRSDLRKEVAKLDQKIDATREDLRGEIRAEVTKLDQKVTKLNKKVDATRKELRDEIRAVGARDESHETRLCVLERRTGVV